MAKPVLGYSPSGSDTGASGAGPAVAVTGTNEAHTGGVSSTTITLSAGADLSGVAVDDVLYLATLAGGRHLTRITSTNKADTLTVAAGSMAQLTGTAHFTVTSAIGATWALTTHVQKSSQADRVYQFFTLKNAGFTPIEGVEFQIATTTGAVTSVATTAGGPYSSSDVAVTDKGDFWQVTCTLTDTAGTAKQIQPQLRLLDAAGGSGVTTERSAVLWGLQLVGSVSGLNEFSSPFDITASIWNATSGATVAADTSEQPSTGANYLTVEDAFTIATGSAVSWAIGGKRKTLTGDPTMNDINQAKAGWTFRFAAGTYLCVGNGTHIFTPIAGTLADGGIRIESETDAWSVFVKPDVTWTTDFRLFDMATSNAAIDIMGMSLSNTVSVSSAAECIRGGGSNVRVTAIRSDFKTPAYSLNCVGVTGVLLVDCRIESTLNSALRFSSASVIDMLDCDVADCGRDGTVPNGSLAAIDVKLNVARASLHMVGCRITNSAGYGIWYNGNSAMIDVGMSNCIIHGSAIDGFVFSGNYQGSQLRITDTIFSNNGGYGITNISGNPTAPTTYADFNAFYNNSSGSYNNITAGANDVALTADPFVDAAGGDFRLNRDVGGGAACRDAGLGL